MPLDSPRLARLVALVQRLVHLIRHELPTLVSLALLAGLGWLLAARGLSGRRLLLWWLVPLLAAAGAAGALGPGRLFPKGGEGPTLLLLSEHHAITLLDLPSALCLLAALLLGGWLLAARWRERRR